MDSWQCYQDALKSAIAPLSEAQLNRRLLPSLRSPGEIAEHIAFGRALWLTRVLADGAAALAPLLQWDDPDHPPRTAAEIVQGLDTTWQVITALLTRGSADDEIPAEEVERLQIIWGLLDHDLPHCGELSLLLGADGLPGVEI